MNHNFDLPTPYIHVDVYPAMTGITRFSYENEDLGWKYNRTEHLNDTDLLVFTHLFTDRKQIDGFKTYKKPFSAFKSLKLRQFLNNPRKHSIIELDHENLFILERSDIYAKRLVERSSTIVD